MLLMVIVVAIQASAAIGQTIPLSEWKTLVALHKSTRGHFWYTGWKITGHAPDGSECSWYGVTCDATPHVTELYLRNNNLVGPLPDLTGLPNLSLLSLGENHITGTLPASIASLSHLARLEVDYNNLTGTLDVLGGLAQLEEFDGDQNTFTGSIPNFSAIPNLVEFSVVNNQLTGRIPQFDNSPNWSYFNIEDNYLSGPVPSIANQHDLQIFVISGNRLSGVMPVPPDPFFLYYYAGLCPGNDFAPIDNTKWDSLTGITPWYTECETGTIFNDGFGAPPTMQ
jgi:hypothetical protein